MRVRLLGTAAGGGFPQWNCACSMCQRAGSPGVPPRSQDGIAVSADNSGWYLFNASPDLRAQILATPALRAGPGPRDTPIRGILLTDAELDHTLGLVTLREAADLRVWTSAPVLDALSSVFPLCGMLTSYADWSWTAVRDRGSIKLPGLRVTMAAVSGKRPRYAAGEPAAPGWVVAYRIEDEASGARLVYAPCLAEWSPAFDELLTGANVVILDGTFYSADELAGHTGRPATPGAGVSTPMGHLPIAGPDGSLHKISERPGTRWIYTHLNNTNPLLAADSPQRGRVIAAGAAVLDDGTELRV
ncbi:MAG: pyrroloquinoline quinone biosynthesis protein PqqB [Pseudonocardia sp.]|nr:pyrroloquinoline quinone biosynthesis protein PqqB [Pseudonocardia sp.]